MAKFNAGDRVIVVGNVSHAEHLAQHVYDARRDGQALTIVRQMPSGVEERGQIEYELSSGAIEPESRLELIERAADVKPAKAPAPAAELPAK